MCLWWAYVCLTTRYYTRSHLHQVFSISLGFSLCFSRVFRTSKFLEFKKFNKTIIPFALVGYETGYSQLGATRLVGSLLNIRVHWVLVGFCWETEITIILALWGLTFTQKFAPNRRTLKINETPTIKPHLPQEEDVSLIVSWSML